MKIAVVAESFLPHMNGVTNSVLQLLKHLRAEGHSAVVIAPATSWAGPAWAAEPAPHFAEGFPVHTLPALPLTGYANVRVAAGTVTRVRRLLEAARPDVVHVASPFVLGWRAIQAANQLGLPTVSVYQTEIPAYAQRYGAPWLEQLLWNHVRTMHSASTLNLAPSSYSMRQLADAGVPRLRMWRRGVDTERFNPQRRSEELRARLAPNGERLIGFVGRLAAEKQVEDLAALADLPGTRLVVVGSGPLKQVLRERLPEAHFAGFLGGVELAETVASLDVFVHPGESETFCQTIQEAMASAVPVVAVGRGGPLDLVDSSRTGWIYAPGDLTDLRSRVTDLVYDDVKRAAFAAAAQASVRGRTWPVLCEQLLAYYREAVLAGADA
ncbi:glycosyltransferase family 1 protein [Zhihengliuella sp.]|uniref:glycosyltransferase family 4 protein n=1 Tax=Zhihengliuella sp. TaxID=1954483 RepID=UPI0028121394|nr:glycosyltransferase family 1 protein [Zhihengliuella sp.]